MSFLKGFPRPDDVTDAVRCQGEQAPFFATAIVDTEKPSGHNLLREAHTRVNVW
jgi:hypothetical protein